MKRLICLILVWALAATAAGCVSAAVPPASPSETMDEVPAEAAAPMQEAEENGGEALQTVEDTMEKALKLSVAGSEVPVVWEENASVEALAELVKTAPLTVQLTMYGGFEQVGPLGASLPRDDVQTTTQAGDIVLYSGDQIVVFYGANSWAYTRLGRITDRSRQQLDELLGNGDVTITLSWG